MRTTLALALLLAGPSPLYAQAPADRASVRLSLNDDGRYRPDDRAEVRVRTDADGYLLVLRTDVNGRVRVMYPLDPSDDNFVRGGEEFEVRGRGDREAFRLSRGNGSGLVLAAWSPRAFDVSAFSLNGHWDFRALDEQASDTDPEAALLAIVDRMAENTNVDFDVLTYTVSDDGRDYRPYYASSNYYAHSYPVSYSWSPWSYRWRSPYYYSSWYPWYSSWNYPYHSSYVCFGSCWPRYGLSFSIGFGYRPWYYRSYYSGYHRPWSYRYAYGYRPAYRYGFASRWDNDWNRGDGWTGRGMRNVRTGAIAVRSRYTAEMSDRRGFTTAAGQSPGNVTARRTLLETGAAAGTTGSFSARPAPRRAGETSDAVAARGSAFEARRPAVERRDVPGGRETSGNGNSLRRVPGRAGESGASSEPRSVGPRRSVDRSVERSGGPSRSVEGSRSVPRREVTGSGRSSGGEVSRPRPSDGGRVYAPRGQSSGSSRPSAGGGGGGNRGNSRPSIGGGGGGGGGGRVSSGGGGRSGGGGSRAAAPSRSGGSSGGGGSPSNSGGGRRR